MRDYVYKKTVSEQLYLWIDLNHGKRKERTLGKGLVLFGEGFMGLKYRIIDIQAYQGTKRGDPQEIKGSGSISFEDRNQDLETIVNTLDRKNSRKWWKLRFALNELVES